MWLLPTYSGSQEPAFSDHIANVAINLDWTKKIWVESNYSADDCSLIVVDGAVVAVYPTERAAQGVFTEIFRNLRAGTLAYQLPAEESV